MVVVWVIGERAEVDALRRTGENGLPSGKFCGR
jgi:hypothetical protein